MLFLLHHCKVHHTQPCHFSSSKCIEEEGDLFTRTPSLIVQKVTELSKNKGNGTAGHLETWTDVKARLRPFSTQSCFPFFSPSYWSILTKILFVFFTEVWLILCLTFPLSNNDTLTVKDCSVLYNFAVLWRNAGQMSHYRYQICFHPHLYVHFGDRPPKNDSISHFSKCRRAP